MNEFFKTLLILFFKRGAALLWMMLISYSTHSWAVAYCKFNNCKCEMRRISTNEWTVWTVNLHTSSLRKFTSRKKSSSVKTLTMCNHIQFTNAITNRPVARILVVWDPKSFVGGPIIFHSSGANNFRGPELRWGARPRVPPAPPLATGLISNIIHKLKFVVNSKPCFHSQSQESVSSMLIKERFFSKKVDVS